MEKHTATLEVKPPTEPTTTEPPDAPGLLNRENMFSQIFERLFLSDILFILLKDLILLIV